MILRGENMDEQSGKTAIMKIAQEINALSGSFTPYVIFSDWVKMCAISISNALEIQNNKVWEKRERAYLDTAAKYTPEQMKKFSELSALLVELYETTGPYDALGEIYMALGCGNKGTGQFFTPYHLSYLTASLAVDKIKSGEKVVVNEPSCGGGGMILAVAKKINEAGGNAQMQMDIVAQDLDWNSVYMTYIQLSLNGLSAVCIQGDSLQNAHVPKERILETPRKRGALI